MFAWVRGMLAPRAVPNGVPIVDTSYVEEIRRNIADIRSWLSEVEAKLPRTQVLAQVVPAPAKPPIDERIAIDREVRAAVSPTGVQKALEREFKVDRRTIYAYVERLVEAYGQQAKYPDWRTDENFWKRWAERDASGKTLIERGLIALGSKAVAA